MRKRWAAQDLEKALTLLGPHSFFIDFSLEQGHDHHPADLLSISVSLGAKAQIAGGPVWLA